MKNFFDNPSGGAKMAHGIGFIEADGSIQLTPKGAVSVEVEQVDPRALYELQNLFGGTVTRRGTRDSWRWRVSKQGHVFDLLTLLGTFGWTLKREQARAVLSFWKGKSQLDSTRRVLRHLKGDRPHRHESETNAGTPTGAANRSNHAFH